MIKNYAVTFINLETRIIKVDSFSVNNEQEARRDFKEVYRHGSYKIISIGEIPA